MTFSPEGLQVAYAQGNDLYRVALADGAVTRLTFDGSETVFNGTLDWVYNEELATRSAQPAYAWSPDGKLADPPAPGRSRGAGPLGDRLPHGAAHAQLYPLPDRRHAEPGA